MLSTSNWLKQTKIPKPKQKKKKNIIVLKQNMDYGSVKVYIGDLLFPIVELRQWNFFGSNITVMCN
jgi:hypothetical protein